MRGICAKIFLKKNLCALQVFLWALISPPVRVRTRTQMRGNIGYDLVLYCNDLFLDCVDLVLDYPVPVQDCPDLVIDCPILYLDCPGLACTAQSWYQMPWLLPRSIESSSLRVHRITLTSFITPTQFACIPERHHSTVDLVAMVVTPPPPLPAPEVFPHGRKTQKKVSRNCLLIVQ